MQGGIHAYPSVFQMGHRAVAELFDGPVAVQEKIDGSQMSFGLVVDEDGATRFHARSKGVELFAETLPSQFAAAYATAKALEPKLLTGWVIRCEAVSKPKHNVLAYGRVPAGNLIVYDIERGDQDYLPPGQMGALCGQLGLECVPLFFYGTRSSLDELRYLLDEQSVLGGPVEGIVVKNYAKYGPDKKVLMAKLVRADFQEKAAKEWKSEKPGRPIVDTIIDALKTEARWRKAIQHLEDEGVSADGPEIIGPALKELHKDLMKEEIEFITEKLLAWALPQIKRGITAGFPEWWKKQLCERQPMGTSVEMDKA